MQGENPHAVRYFNAWEENDVVYIQTELCQRTLAQEWHASKPLYVSALALHGDSHGPVISNALGIRLPRSPKFSDLDGDQSPPTPTG